MEEKRCKNCESWHRDGIDGVCRKNSPRPVIMEQGKTYVVVWPKFKGDEPACGDFKPFTVS